MPVLFLIMHILSGDTYFVQVLVCEKMKLNGEYYFAIVMDRAFKVSMTYMTCTC